MADDARDLMRLRSVRVHNLKAIDLDLPRNQLIVITGVSGSGKSSLAFDTIYAEGQRRYIETFSPYVRQFLGRLDKPDADAIEGLPAAVAIGQRIKRRGARATVGSVSEVHDALALLYSRAGEVICPDCRLSVTPATVAQVESAIATLPDGARYLIGYPLEIQATTDRAALAASLKALGMMRVQIDGATVALDDPAIAWPDSGEVTVVIDRLRRGTEAPDRLRDSIESAFQYGMGRCRIVAETETLTFLRGWVCARCGRNFAAPEPRLFRPESPVGACQSCQGYGRVIDIDLTRVVPDAAKTLEQGAIAAWTTPGQREWQEHLVRWAPTRGIPIDLPFKRLDEHQTAAILTGDRDFGGLRGFFDWLERKAYKLHARVLLSRWRGYKPCPECKGARLRPEALAVRVNGVNIAELSAQTIAQSRAFVEELRQSVAASAGQRSLRAAFARLAYLERIGLGYLTLDRPARTLSTGESRRLSLTAALGSGLVNTLYVLDEPSIGLHPRDIMRLTQAIRSLQAAPNSVVVVDHDESMMRSADMLVDIGPGAGESGGRVVFAGTPDAIVDAPDSITGDFLAGRRRVTIPYSRRKRGETLLLKGARGHNLSDLSVEFPLGVICAVTGVSGSGKSSLVEETLYPALMRRIHNEHLPALPYEALRGANALTDVQLVDQSPIGRTPRSNPVTYLKAYDEIRKSFASTHEAKLRNYTAGRFSFNVEGGRCETCQGNGVLVIDMQFLSDVTMRCTECRGRRFRADTLDVTYRGKNIAEVLDLTAREAFGFFRNRPKIQLRLRPLLEVGLDYLRLGQPANTLSGGESQRLKLASHLASAAADVTAKSRCAFILDEPTTGLHPADIVRLVDCLNALVDRGHSVIVVEHSPEIMVAADWIIDLGPDAGGDGGRIVAQGTPEDVARAETHTGRLLAEWLARRPATADSEE